MISLALLPLLKNSEQVRNACKNFTRHSSIKQSSTEESQSTLFTHNLILFTTQQARQWDDLFGSEIESELDGSQASTSSSRMLVQQRNLGSPRPQDKSDKMQEIKQNRPIPNVEAQLRSSLELLVIMDSHSFRQVEVYAACLSHSQFTIVIANVRLSLFYLLGG